MNKNAAKLLNLGRKIYLHLNSYKKDNRLNWDPAALQPITSGQEASDLIKKRLNDSNPLMACRIGTGEMAAMLVYFYQNNLSSFQKVTQYLSGRIEKFWWDDYIIGGITENAGVFPKDRKTLERFAQRMLADLKDIDILASWLYKEDILKEKYFPNAALIRLKDLEPYYSKEPWSNILENKKVLIIHPFAKTITEQYKKRTLLFENKKILPLFELKTIQAVQSIAHNKTGFLNWFEALDFMCEQVDKADFEIALIGCGAYGLPLAAHVKRKGKKAIHLGAGTQILFGIKGKRWENPEHYPEIYKLFNEHWVRPDKSEIPLNFDQIEDGCYW